MPRKRKPTTDAVEIIHRRYFDGRPKRIAELEAARESIPRAVPNTTDALQTINRITGKNPKLRTLITNATAKASSSESRVTRRKKTSKKKA